MQLYELWCGSVINKYVLYLCNENEWNYLVAKWMAGKYNEEQKHLYVCELSTPVNIKMHYSLHILSFQFIY